MYTYPSLRKAIPLMKIELNKKINFKVIEEEKSKNSCNKNNKSELINSNKL